MDRINTFLSSLIILTEKLESILLKEIQRCLTSLNNLKLLWRGARVAITSTHFNQIKRENTLQKLSKKSLGNKELKISLHQHAPLI
jgi:hypothetical protein